MARSCGERRAAATARASQIRPLPAPEMIAVCSEECRKRLLAF